MEHALVKWFGGTRGMGELHFLISCSGVCHAQYADRSIYERGDLAVL